MKEDRVFKRFIEILKPDFLAKHFVDLDSNQTWKFWFLSNTLATLVIATAASFGIMGATNQASQYLEENYANAKISLEAGKLRLEGIPEPIFVESEDGEVFVVDTQRVKYDESILNDFKEGVFISDSKIYSKKNSVETEQFDFSQAKGDFALTQKDVTDKKWVANLFIIAFVLVAAWIYLNIFRLISALWWALLFWLLGLAMRVENLNFSKVYFSVLNFYIIPLTVFAILMFFSLEIPLLTTGIFLIIFVANYLRLKKASLLSKKEPLAETPEVK